MNDQSGNDPRSIMDDRHHLERELERRIEQMNRRMEEQEREMERRIEAMRRQFEESTPRPEPPSWPTGEGPSSTPISGPQDRTPELDPTDVTESDPSVGPGMINIDIIDEDEEFVVMANVPGFSKDEIDVRLDNDVLHIEAVREETEVQEDEAEEEEEKQYVQRERPRSISRLVPLRGPIAEEDLSARYENGVLTIRLPKGEQVEDLGRPIEIE